MMKKQLVLAAFALLVAAACSKKAAAPTATATPPPPPAPIAPVPTQADADRATLKTPGTTLAMLQEGQTLYVNNCGKCHPLFRPAQFSEEQWRHEVPPMIRKARMDPSTEPLVLAYVLAMREAN